MTIAALPDPPLAGDVVTLASTLSQDGATHWRITSRPSDSLVELDSLLGSGGEFVATFTPDEPGVYGVSAMAYMVATAQPGLPAPVDEVFVGFEEGAISVGSASRLPLIMADGQGATLRLVGVGTTVVSAELIDPTTEAARVAILDAGVIAALDDIVGKTALEITGELAERATDLRTQYEGHRASHSTVHLNTGDAVNVMQRFGATSETYAVALVNDLYEKLSAHAQSWFQGGNWHTGDDSKNVPVARKAQSLSDAVVALCDLRVRVYERHRVQVTDPAVHAAADSANILLSAATPLDALVAAFFDATLVAATPAGESPIGVGLAQYGGFVRE